ncbi:RNA polymerase sigma factor [Bacteroides ihuae]|uniref:RNA polymerase sigma factor n=1 Tax=Bacteroides ihuae TaxID=1852362 RepID=UPI0008DAAAB7|nr:RNA polymerase sigma factor [Bacteroides ihuae]
MKSIQEDFLKIVSDYQGIIHKVNLIYFRVIVDREDNFQEILLQLWRSFPQLKDRTKIGSWIYTVAINTSISKIRKDSKLVFQELTDSALEMSLIEDNAGSFEVDFNFQKLIEALHQLNQIDRSIMLLYLEELDYNEIAEIMGITSTNVGVRINRSKKQLKKYLNK